MNVLIGFIKRQIVKMLAYFGYILIANRDYTIVKPINVFPLIVADHVSKNPGGFKFIQIGANDGIKGDPISPLIRKYGNWVGVLVEPNPKVMKTLKRNYENVSGLQFEEAAISDSDGSAILYCPVAAKDDPSMFASLNLGSVAMWSNTPEHVKTYESIKAIEQVNVKTLTLASLFKKYDVTALDLFQVDTEGHDYKIIIQLIQSAVRPKIIQFENASMNGLQFKECLGKLSKLGYSCLNVDIDTIAVQDLVASRSNL